MAEVARGHGEETSGALAIEPPGYRDQFGGSSRKNNELCHPKSGYRRRELVETG